MRSMTGYGRGTAHFDGRQITVELSSVNRKQVEIALNLPRALLELEPRVRDEINAHISRGRLTVAVGPEHAWLRDERRVDYTYCTDDDALAAFRFLCATEGIIPAMESAHAIAEAMKIAPTLPPEQIIVICLSGRGDKDVEQVARALKI